MTQPTPDRSRCYATFREFYPFYLGEHRNAACRRLHVIGSALVLVALGAAIATRNPWLSLLMPLIGYGFAWVGHFAFEKNRQAGDISLSALEPDGRLGHVRRGRRRPQAVLKLTAAPAYRRARCASTCSECRTGLRTAYRDPG